MPTPEIIENSIYSTEELSKIFDISFQDMRLLIKRGHIKGAKIGKNWFVSGKSLLKLFEEEPDLEKGKNIETLPEEKNLKKDNVEDL